MFLVFSRAAPFQEQERIRDNVEHSYFIAFEPDDVEAIEPEEIEFRLPARPELVITVAERSSRNKNQ